MEEVRFSVTTVMDEKLALSFENRVHKLRYLAFYALLAVFSVWMAADSAKRQLWGFFWLYVALIAAILLKYFVFSRRQHVRKTFESYRSLCKADPKKTARFTDSDIVYRDENTGSVVHISYADIFRLLETKDALYLLNKKAAVAVCVSKSGFTQGGPEGLIAFLAEKKPGLKPKSFCIM
ncbi:MAG: YcxB family protein [Clostridia bacterium]|nr:YcxB family protein [Clostridia bacterium]